MLSPFEDLTMTRNVATIAAALLLTAIATPVFAQAAIQEPGAYSFYHPNADVLAGRGAYRAPDANALFGANAYYNQVTPAPPVRQRTVAPRRHRTVQ
jgi:hypothetical protein